METAVYIAVAIILAWVTLLIGLVGKLLKGRLDRIESRMDCFEKSQAACQLGNSKEFATWAEHNKLAEDVKEGFRNHGERIARLEAGRASRKPPESESQQ